MFHRTKLSTGLMLAFGCSLVMSALPSAAQQRVEITGSSIKRSVNDEGALPITV